MSSLISSLILHERQFTIFIAFTETIVITNFQEAIPAGRSTPVSLLGSSILNYREGSLYLPLSIGILQARILEWVAMPFSRGSSQSREIKPTFPTLQADFSPSEPPGKPKNNVVGSLSLLQGIIPTRNQTEVFCMAGRFFTSWAIREAWIIGRCPYVNKLSPIQSFYYLNTGVQYS